MANPDQDVITEPLRAAGLAAAFGAEPGADRLVEAAAALAGTLGLPWEALYVETPGTDRDGPEGLRAAEALALATRLGGTVASIAAASLADGIVAHLASSPAAHLVLGHLRLGSGARWWRRSEVDAVAERAGATMVHVVPLEPDVPASAGRAVARGTPAPPRHYLLAAIAVGATLLVAELLQFVTGTRALDLVFLFPLIAVAARLGFEPALLAAGLSVFSYNYFLLAPALSFDPRAPQNIVMVAVFVGIAAYTSTVTQRMRQRVLLSDRSARENATVAMLAQRLTRDSGWEATAQTLCEHVHSLFAVQAAVFREVGGELTLAGAVPQLPRLGPVDQAALDWCWAHGEEAGAGTAIVSASDWQFQPLQTSLGKLAVLGLARDDGRDPVRPDQRVLLATVVGQAALAHERLRLEDGMKAGAAAR